MSETNGQNGSAQGDVELNDARPIDAESEEPVPATVPAEELKAWEERALAAEAKLRDFTDAFRQYKQEYDGIRARFERDREQKVRESVGRAFGRILDALDNLEIAVNYAGEGALADGLKLALKGVHDALAAEGLEKMSLVGETFDPQFAEAVGLVPVNDAALHGKVLAEMRAGYSFHGQVLRPAQVRVGSRQVDS